LPPHKGCQSEVLKFSWWWYCAVMLNPQWCPKYRIIMESTGNAAMDNWTRLLGQHACCFSRNKYNILWCTYPLLGNGLVKTFPQH
jgi:hypothetical protein